MAIQNMKWLGVGNVIPKPIEHHFSKIEKKHHNLKTTVSESISVIADKLKHLDRIEAADISCGAGRYDILLYRYLGDKLNLTCLDSSAEMLKSLGQRLVRHGVHNFSVVRSDTGSIPLPDNKMDCLCTFNVIHHFNLPCFLKESARVIKNGGYLFIYTRLREQNGRNTGGRYIPQFNEEEIRLYSLATMKQAIEATDNLRIESIVFFTYSRLAALEELTECAKSHQPSAFPLYSPEELKEALKGFSINFATDFEDTRQVRWFDENVLFIIKKE